MRNIGLALGDRRRGRKSNHDAFAGADMFDAHAGKLKRNLCLRRAAEQFIAERIA